ncbi:MAG TPA: Mrp/NBP35 family ATP-binding protein [Gemmatimonadaceae bacterium]|nr:Mrp/NBP35 family ATP-binding protein [Gemmatimonadaceae bacterium]
MAENLQDRIRSALSGVRNPRLGINVLDAEMIRDIAINPDGRVRLTLLLSSEDDATLVRDVYAAVAAVEGVVDVRVDPKDASSQPPSPPRRMLPVMDAAPKAPPRPPAPTPSAYPNLGRIIAVSSGKGGVGKSTVAVNLAVALSKHGARVGLMDADIYGPNVPRMMGVGTPPPVVDQRMIPPVVHGIKVISLGLLIPRDQPAIWRGPIVMKLIGQFLKDVDWGQLDFLIVDMPPGTGDAQLSLVQSTHVHGALIVTTPQMVATGDALRGVKMFERVNVPVLGIVENMSYFECPHCGKPSPIFGQGGGEALATEVGLPLLARIPLDPRVVAGGDTGVPIVVSAPESGAAVALSNLAARVTDAVNAAVPA